jgi:hypothetical protein
MDIIWGYEKCIQNFVWTYEWNLALWIPGRRWKDNINNVEAECDGVYWIRVSEDQLYRLAIVNMQWTIVVHESRQFLYQTRNHDLLNREHVQWS